MTDFDPAFVALVQQSQNVTPKLLLTMESQACPHCKTSLIAQVIPQGSRHLYLGFEYQMGENGKLTPVPKQDDGRFMFYSHVIGMSSMLFDRTLAFTCPFCKTTDIIPGLEEAWVEEQAYWAEHVEVELLGKSEADPYAPAPGLLPDLSKLTNEELQNEFTRKFGIADHLNSGEDIGPENEAYIQVYEAECKRRGLDSGMQAEPSRAHA